MMPSVHSVPSVVTGEVASLIYHLPICHLPPAHSPAQPSPCCPNKVSHILCPGLIWTQTVDSGDTRQHHNSPDDHCQMAIFLSRRGLDTPLQYQGWDHQLQFWSHSYVHKQGLRHFGAWESSHYSGVNLVIKMGCRGSEEAGTCGLELISAPGPGSRKLCAANEHGVMTKCNTATTPAPAPASQGSS